MLTIDLNDLFDKGMELHHITNTAYPLKPTSFMDYKVKNRQHIEELLSRNLNNTKTMSLYVHVPFCKSRCKFCEYAVVSGDEKELKDEYVKKLCDEIDFYRHIINTKIEILGFDIGGGTPTELNESQLEQIVEKMRSVFNIGMNNRTSIETTPINAIKYPERLSFIRSLGFDRMSMGIQTVNESLLKSFERDGSVELYRKAVNPIRTAKFDKFNIDLMYGFRDQSIEDFQNTVRYAISLKPEYITLYEMRYKMTKLLYEAKDVTRAKVNRQYRIAFEELNNAGYIANYGKNTFCKIPGDEGTSEYLTRRVIDVVPYLGFGLAAQSFGLNYLAYNLGAADKSLKKYLTNDAPLIQDIYDLPLDEVIAKAISVMFYFGYIDIQTFHKRFGISVLDRFREELEYLKLWNLIEITSDKIWVTRNGVSHLGGVIPMFYSARAKDELMAIEKLY